MMAVPEQNIDSSSYEFYVCRDNSTGLFYVLPTLHSWTTHIYRATLIPVSDVQRWIDSGTAKGNRTTHLTPVLVKSKKIGDCVVDFSISLANPDIKL